MEQDCIKLELPSLCLGRTAGGLLLLPEAGVNAALILLHGAQESPETVLENSTITALAEEQGLAVLLPELDNSFGLDWGAGQDYRSFLLGELLPEARKRCPAFRPPCAVGGISMGGFAALSLALENPLLFDRAFSLSGALDLRRAAQLSRISGIRVPDGFEACAASMDTQLSVLLETALPKPPLYLAWGDADWFAAANAGFAGKAGESGFPVKTAVSPGLHNWEYWRRSLPPAVRWAAGSSSCA